MNKDIFLEYFLETYRSGKILTEKIIKYKGEYFGSICNIYTDSSMSVRSVISFTCDQERYFSLKEERSSLNENWYDCIEDDEIVKFLKSIHNVRDTTFYYENMVLPHPFSIEMHIPVSPTANCYMFKKVIQCSFKNCVFTEVFDKEHYDILTIGCDVTGGWKAG